MTLNFQDFTTECLPSGEFVCFCVQVMLFVLKNVISLAVCVLIIVLSLERE